MRHCKLSIEGNKWRLVRQREPEIGRVVAGQTVPLGQRRQFT
jgi:hypothetical protein